MFPFPLFIFLFEWILSKSKNDLIINSRIKTKMIKIRYILCVCVRAHFSSLIIPSIIAAGQSRDKHKYICNLYQLMILFLFFQLLCVIQIVCLFFCLTRVCYTTFISHCLCLCVCVCVCCGAVYALLDDYYSDGG